LKEQREPKLLKQTNNNKLHESVITVSLFSRRRKETSNCRLQIPLEEGERKPSDQCERKKSVLLRYQEEVYIIMVRTKREKAKEGVPVSAVTTKTLGFHHWGGRIITELTNGDRMQTRRLTCLTEAAISGPMPSPGKRVAVMGP
jgi:hypothetical protein